MIAGDLDRLLCFGCSVIDQVLIYLCSQRFIGSLFKIPHLIAVCPCLPENTIGVSLTALHCQPVGFQIGSIFLRLVSTVGKCPPVEGIVRLGGNGHSLRCYAAGIVPIGIPIGQGDHLSGLAADAAVGTGGKPDNHLLVVGNAVTAGQLVIGIVQLIFCIIQLQYIFAHAHGNRRVFGIVKNIAGYRDHFLRSKDRCAIGNIGCGILRCYGKARRLIKILNGIAQIFIVLPVGGIYIRLTALYRLGLEGVYRFSCPVGPVAEYIAFPGFCRCVHRFRSNRSAVAAFPFGKGIDLNQLTAERTHRFVGRAEQNQRLLMVVDAVAAGLPVRGVLPPVDGDHSLDLADLRVHTGSAFSVSAYQRGTGGRDTACRLHGRGVVAAGIDHILFAAGAVCHYNAAVRQMQRNDLNTIVIG